MFLPALAVIVTSYGWRWAAGTVAIVAVLLVAPIAVDLPALVPRRHGPGALRR